MVTLGSATEALRMGTGERPHARASGQPEEFRKLRPELSPTGFGSAEVWVPLWVDPDGSHMTVPAAPAAGEDLVAVGNRAGERPGLVSDRRSRSRLISRSRISDR